MKEDILELEKDNNLKILEAPLSLWIGSLRSSKAMSVNEPKMGLLPIAGPLGPPGVARRFMGQRKSMILESHLYPSGLCQTRVVNLFA